MPPLREHSEDIEELCQAGLQEFSTLHGRTVTIAASAIACLKGYDFPGNARELRNIIERASVLCPGTENTPADQPGEIAGKSEPAGGVLNLGARLAAAEKECILTALRESGGNRTEAAKLLGISRKNLWEKMKNLSLE